MEIELTCLSCTKSFAINTEDLPKSDYLACIGCQKPVPADLLEALKLVSQCFKIDNKSNSALWYIRCRSDS